MKFFSRILFDLDRDLKHPKLTFKIYATLFCILFAAHFCFGIIPLYKIVKQKRMVVNDLIARVEVTKSNLDKLEAAKVALADHEDDVRLLDAYMPLDTGIQAYMLDFVAQSGKAGFVVKNFSQVTNSKVENAIEITVALESKNYPIGLIKEIEKLKRVTQITKMNVVQRKPGEYYTSMGLIIYNYVP